MRILSNLFISLRSKIQADFIFWDRVFGLPLNSCLSFSSAGITDTHLYTHLQHVFYIYIYNPYSFLWNKRLPQTWLNWQNLAISPVDVWNQTQVVISHGPGCSGNISLLSTDYFYTEAPKDKLRALGCRADIRVRITELFLQADTLGTQYELQTVHGIR